jgi:hypothetical protein
MACFKVSHNFHVKVIIAPHGPQEGIERKPARITNLIIEVRGLVVSPGIALAYLGF